MTVTLSSSDASIATAQFAGGGSTASLSATTEASFSITAVDDASHSTQDRTATITLTASSTNSSERYDDVTETVTVVVGENPVRVSGAGLSPVADVSGTEGGAAVARTLKLTAQPRSDVTVSLLPESAASGVSFASDSAGATAITRLSFTGGSDGNWNTAQTFYTVFGEDADSVDDADRIRLVATGSGYAGVVGEFSVATADDDRTPVGLSIGGAPSATEGDAASFTVRLQSAPSADVQVTATPGAGIASVSPSTLTFTANNWDTAQSISAVTLADDDAVNATGRVSLSASGGGYDDQDAEVDIAITDDDTASLTLPAGTLNIDEGGSGTFTVRLAAEPSGDVTVRAAAGAGLSSVAPSSLSFTVDNWDADQTVHVIPDIDDDADDSTATVSLTASGGGYGSATGQVSVSVTDTQGAAASTVSHRLSRGSALWEGNNSAEQINIYLSERPTQGVIQFNISAGALGENPTPGSGSVQYDPVTGHSNTARTKLSTTVNLTPSSWSSATAPFFVINVWGEQDADTQDGSGQIRVEIKAGASAATLQPFPGGSFSVPYTVTDDDTAGVSPSFAPVKLDEDGAAVQVALRLATRPENRVFFNITSSDPEVFTVSPDSINFTNNNCPSNLSWNCDQSITVTPVDDEVFTAAVKRAEIRVTALPRNPAARGYGHGFSDTIAVEVREDERNPGLTRIADIAGPEGGAPVARSVALTQRPAANATVTVSLASDNPDVSFASDAAGTSAITQLSFTAANWDTPQTFYTVLADDADVGDDSATVTLVAAGGGLSWGALSYAVAIADTDTPGTLALSGAAEEGVDSSLSAVLTRRPSANVTATRTGFSGIVQPSTTSLTFTPANWNVPQTLAVRGSVGLSRAGSGGLDHLDPRRRRLRPDRPPHHLHRGQLGRRRHRRRRTGADGAGGRARRLQRAADAAPARDGQRHRRQRRCRGGAEPGGAELHGDRLEHPEEADARGARGRRCAGRQHRRHPERLRRRLLRRRPQPDPQRHRRRHPRAAAVLECAQPRRGRCGRRGRRAAARPAQRRGPHRHLQLGQRRGCGRRRRRGHRGADPDGLQPRQLGRTAVVCADPRRRCRRR